MSQIAHDVNDLAEHMAPETLELVNQALEDLSMAEVNLSLAGSFLKRGDHPWADDDH